MTKNYLSIFLLLIFTIGKAQFVGQYDLRDGGEDELGSQLLILPEQEFIIFYYGGFKKGTWKELDKNTIELKEVPLFADPVLMYGKYEKSSSATIKFDVQPLYESHAFIRFSKDENFTDELKPIFNNWPNCMEQEYEIKKNTGDYNFVNISLPANPEFGEFGIEYPYKVLNYVFPLDKKFNYFTILHSKDNNTRLLNWKMIKKGNKYIVDNDGDSEELEKKDFDKEILDQIEEVKNIKQDIELEENWGEAIAGVEKDIEIVYKFNPNPIFKAYCKSEEKDNSGPDYYTRPRKLTAINRENGVYAVSNYNPENIKEEEFIVAKTSSLNQKDFLSAVKQVSDFDGYEIKLTFTEQGSAKFSELLQKNPRKPVAFVIDNKVVDKINPKNAKSLFNKGRDFWLEMSISFW